MFVCVDIFQDDMLKLFHEGIEIYDCATNETARIHCMLLCAIADYRGMPELTHQMGHPALTGACLLCCVKGKRLRDGRTTVYPHVCRNLPTDEEGMKKRQTWRSAMSPEIINADYVDPRTQEQKKVEVFKLPPFQLKTNEQIAELVQQVEQGEKQPNEVGFHGTHALSRSPHWSVVDHYLNCCMHMLKNAAQASFSYPCAYHDLKWRFRKDTYKGSRFQNALDAVSIHTVRSLLMDIRICICMFTATISRVSIICFSSIGQHCSSPSLPWQYVDDHAESISSWQLLWYEIA